MTELGLVMWNLLDLKSVFIYLYSFFTATCLTIVIPLLNGHLGDRRSGHCREVAIIERFNEESMFGLSAKKSGCCRDVPLVENWPYSCTCNPSNIYPEQGCVQDLKLLGII